MRHFLRCGSDEGRAGIRLHDAAELRDGIDGELRGAGEVKQRPQLVDLKLRGKRAFGVAAHGLLVHLGAELGVHIADAGDVCAAAKRVRGDPHGFGAKGNVEIIVRKLAHIGRVLQNVEGRVLDTVQTEFLEILEDFQTRLVALEAGVVIDVEGEVTGFLEDIRIVMVKVDILIFILVMIV